VQSVESSLLTGISWMENRIATNVILGMNDNEYYKSYNNNQTGDRIVS